MTLQELEDKWGAYLAADGGLPVENGVIVRAHRSGVQHFLAERMLRRRFFVHLNAESGGVCHGWKPHGPACLLIDSLGQSLHHAV
jgi:hypothetical protein